MTVQMDELSADGRLIVAPPKTADHTLDWIDAFAVVFIAFCLYFKARMCTSFHGHNLRLSDSAV